MRARIIAAMDNERAGRRLHPLVGWILALLAMAAFCGLGAWQLGRAKQKEAMLASAEEILKARKAIPLREALDLSADRFDWVEATGDFVAGPRLLLDNQLREGRAGIRVYCLFSPAQGFRTLLVDMGWLPLNGSRDLPTTTCPQGEMSIRGLMAPPPASGLRLGEARVRIDDSTWLATRIEPSATGRIWGVVDSPSPRVLKLDPAIRLGYARDLDILPNTLPPERHLGYAVQWFGLALAVFVTALVLSLRQRRRSREKMAA